MTKCSVRLSLLLCLAPMASAEPRSVVLKIDGSEIPFAEIQTRDRDAWPSLVTVPTPKHGVCLRQRWVLGGGEPEPDLVARYVLYGTPIWGVAIAVNNSCQGATYSDLETSSRDVAVRIYQMFVDRVRSSVVPPLARVDHWGEVVSCATSNNRWQLEDLGPVPDDDDDDSQGVWGAWFVGCSIAEVGVMKVTFESRGQDVRLISVYKRSDKDKEIEVP